MLELTSLDQELAVQNFEDTCQISHFKKLSFILSKQYVKVFVCLHCFTYKQHNRTRNDEEIAIIFEPRFAVIFETCRINFKQIPSVCNSQDSCISSNRRVVREISK